MRLEYERRSCSTSRASASTASTPRASPPARRARCTSARRTGSSSSTRTRCRSWRMCVSGCPYKKVYFNWQSGKAEKCTLCYPRLETGPADDLLGDLRRPDPLPRRRPLRRRPRRGGRLRPRREGPARRAALALPRPGRPRGAGAGLARRDRGGLARGRAPLAGLHARRRAPGRAAAPSRVPDAADGLVRAAALAGDEHDRGRGLRRPTRTTSSRRSTSCGSRSPTSRTC